MNQLSNAAESVLPTNHDFDLWGMIRRRRGFLILGVILGLLAAALYFFLVPPTFRAQMEILVGQKSGDLVKGANSNSAGEGVDAEEDVLSTHIQLMTSRRILQAAIENHDLMSLTSIQEAVAEDIPVIAYIKDNLSVTKGGDGVAKDAHTLRATYDDPSRVDCAVIMRAIYDEYESYLQQHFEGTSTQAVDLLTNLSNKIEANVRAAEKDLSENISNSRLMWEGDQSRNIHKERLDRIERELADLTQSEVETKSRLAVIAKFLSSKDLEEVTDFDRLALLSEKEVSRLKLMFDVTKGDVASEAFQAEQPIRQETARAEYDEYLKLVMREKKLLESFSDKHPSVTSVREQLKMMRSFIDRNSAKIEASESRDRMEPADMFTTYVELLKNDLLSIEQQREILLERSQQELLLAKELEGDEMMVQSQRNELSRQQDLYRSSMNTLQELNFVRDYAGFSTDVIGDAEPQEKASWPVLWIVLALGMVGGGSLGFGLAMLSELCDTTFVNPEDVQMSLKSVLLGHVPNLPKLRRRRKEPAFEVSPSIYVHHRPRTPEAEVYRVIRTGLLTEAKRTDQRLIQITSPFPGDGKTTTCINLAAALAQTGKRVLVIDGDLRKPQIAKQLYIESDVGLTDVLLEELEPMDVVIETAIPNLSAIVSGAIPSAPSELLQSETFSSVLQFYKDRFDYVLIDSPPVLAVSDPAIIAPLCDGVVIALRIIKNGRKSAIRAKQILEQQHANVTGLVVNGYQASSRHYGYADGYDLDVYGYGYGPTGRGYYQDDGQPVRKVVVQRKDSDSPLAEPVSQG